ncbi:peptidyl-prolyl cis-trans isomerase cyp6-like [Homarus americanus]|uniref:peptidyl-prolyl cis-trans isomerase cyp6-like n=1 Tax=Homarus americanus TaxID=6706 RepID=UPI001C45BF45|nr:peptidyl-prolyl cis-trans isomerase cyp6-like [Homarus americanus]
MFGCDLAQHVENLSVELDSIEKYTNYLKNIKIEGYGVSLGLSPKVNKPQILTRLTEMSSTSEDKNLCITCEKLLSYIDKLRIPETGIFVFSAEKLKNRNVGYFSVYYPPFPLLESYVQWGEKFEVADLISVKQHAKECESHRQSTAPHEENAPRYDYSHRSDDYNRRERNPPRYDYSHRSDDYNRRERNAPRYDYSHRSDDYNRRERNAPRYDYSHRSDDYNWRERNAPRYDYSHHHDDYNRRDRNAPRYDYSHRSRDYIR